MTRDTHRVSWKVTHDSENLESPEFVSLTKALRFIRDESVASNGHNGRVTLVSDDMTVATFSAHDDGVHINDDAISLVQDAWAALDT
jgi:hypothetical protein